MSLEIQETSLLSLQGWINGGTDGGAASYTTTYLYQFLWCVPGCDELGMA